MVSTLRKLSKRRLCSSIVLKISSSFELTVITKILSAVNTLNQARKDFASKLEMFENHIKIRRRRISEIEKEIKEIHQVCDDLTNKMTEVDNVIANLSSTFGINFSVNSEEGGNLNHK